MGKELYYSQVPFNYEICLNRECPQANTCLRQFTEKNMPSHVKTWTVISPKYLATLKGACPFYRSSAKVRFAQGFVNLLNNLPYKQMQIVVAHLLTHFNRRVYYKVRKGERLLSPSEQDEIRNILRSCGVSQPQEFDAYVETYDW